jgi:hypothetical protein
MLSYIQKMKWEEMHPMPTEIGGAADLAEPLSEQQIRALLSLQSSRNFTLAAKHAGVTRKTVHHWMKFDPHFQAAYNAWKLEGVASGRARIYGTIDGAVDTLTFAAENGDVRAAETVLKATGVLGDQQVGATSSRAAMQEIELRERQQAAELALLRKQVAELEARQSDSPHPPRKQVESIEIALPSASAATVAPLEEVEEIGDEDEDDEA